MAVVVGLNLLLSGCAYHVEEELYPTQNDCDTVAVSYSMQIVPILESVCYTCHTVDTGILIGGGNIFDSHAGILPYADSGTLVCVVEFAAGCSAMPPSGEQLSSCNLALINSWVNNGAPNN